MHIKFNTRYHIWQNLLIYIIKIIKLKTAVLFLTKKNSILNFIPFSVLFYQHLLAFLGTYGDRSLVLFFSYPFCVMSPATEIKRTTFRLFHLDENYTQHYYTTFFYFILFTKLKLIKYTKITKHLRRWSSAFSCYTFFFYCC